MFKRTVLSVFCAAALISTGAAYAQDSATLTLRSGEKVSGSLVDLGGVGYTVRVNGNERTIPQNDVSVIDFTGGLNDADWTSFNGTSKVVLRNGQTIDGSLYDISGISPLKLTIRTANGERELSSGEVARIVISRPENVAVATSGSNPAVANTPAVAGAITVLANQAWTSTGVTVRKGQTISLTTTGEVQMSDDANDIANANGAKSGRMATNPQLRAVPAGALIGKIGPNGTPFGIGAQTSIVAPAAGVLYLGVNDEAHGDNKGNYQVIVR